MVKFDPKIMMGPEEMSQLTSGKAIHSSSNLFQLSPYVDQGEIMRLGRKIRKKSDNTIAKTLFYETLVITDVHQQAGQEYVVKKCRQKYCGILQIRKLLEFGLQISKFLKLPIERLSI